ncbi:hypothetical protein GCM10008013_42870 [Paenibacillus segetis]|uniref:Uncharacterized protein n=1 Tax=Paenibacillus segetis TaxID=1325360 RepID=A0ABQ1YRL6_9BACL|nr:hypothetical protein GCM10008013_42870 [Paenibacillus segetis]
MASVLSNLEPFVVMIMGLILLSKPITGVEIRAAECSFIIRYPKGKKILQVMCTGLGIFVMSMAM